MLCMYALLQVDYWTGNYSVTIVVKSMNEASAASDVEAIP